MFANSSRESDSICAAVQQYGGPADLYSVGALLAPSLKLDESHQHLLLHLTHHNRLSFRPPAVLILAVPIFAHLATRSPRSSPAHGGLVTACRRRKLI